MTNGIVNGSDLMCIVFSVFLTICFTLKYCNPSAEPDLKCWGTTYVCCMRIFWEAIPLRFPIFSLGHSVGW